MKELNKKTFDEFITEWLKNHCSDESKFSTGVNLIKDIPNRNPKQVPNKIWRLLLWTSLKDYHNN